MHFLYVFRYLLFINIPHFSFNEDDIPSTMHLRIIWQLSEEPVTEYANEENKKLPSPSMQHVLLGI